MPEADGSDSKQFQEGLPQRGEIFFLKGSTAYDWGMQHGRTVMLAIDHGFFQGPTTGLERVDLSIRPLVPYADALTVTRDDIAHVATLGADLIVSGSAIFDGTSGAADRAASMLEQVRSRTKVMAR